MRRTAQVLSLLALAATLVPALLFFADRLSLAQAKDLMLASAVIWFASAPLWMDRKTNR